MNVDITPEMLRRLKQLCHPDRHGSSKLAETVMVWLNAIEVHTFPSASVPRRPAADIFGFSTSAAKEQANLDVMMAEAKARAQRAQFDELLRRYGNQATKL